MLVRKLFRTVWKYKAQFFSMIIMIALGVGVFVGFNTEWNSVEENTSRYFKQTNFADFRVFTEQPGGFTTDDIGKIKDIEGVDNATRCFAVNVGIKDYDSSLSLNVVEDYGISSFIVYSGVEYSADNSGIWLSDRFAAENKIDLGDTLTMTYRNMEISGQIVGLIKSSEYMVCIADENQIMPDYSSFGFAYISPKTMEAAIGVELYPQINIKSSLSKEDISLKIDSVLEKTVLSLSKDENVSYAAKDSEIEEGKTMGSILPVLFLLIALLTMVTTMHRITANEKTQIGTLKALGFRDKRILAHYVSYGLIIGLIGTLLGIGLGLGIAAFIMNPNGMMGTYFDLPEWNLYIPWFGWLVSVAVVATLTFIGYLSVKQMLRGTAADSLRAYTPKVMHQTLLEKTKLWNKLSFGTKWNFRDIMRHKSRSFMTLIGVIGCMVLLVGGLGMKDTMTGFMNDIDKTTNYQTRINLSETATNEKALEIADAYNGDLLSSSSVRYEERAVTLEIVSISYDNIKYYDSDNKVMAISNDGAYICVRIADGGVSVGDSINISPYGDSSVYTVKVAGIIRSTVTENILMSDSYAKSIGISYRYTAIFTDTAQNEILSQSDISGIQTKTAIMDSYDSFLEVMNTMVFVLVLAAVVLGLVVLYSLGAMSYTERYREMATLKVVGFRDKHIAKLLIGQNTWLSIIGVIIGLPAGVGTLYYLIKALATEYEMKMVVGALTYTVSILLTLLVSLVVSFFIARKNRKIDMVEALKCAE